MSKTTRIEIINALYSRMIQHIEYPTTEDYKVACWRLVNKFEVMKDSIGLSGIVRMLLVFIV